MERGIKYSVFIFLLLFLADVVTAQPFTGATYNIRFREQATVDYSHLLDTGSRRQFKNHLQLYSGKLLVQKTSDDFLYVQFRIDSLQENNGHPVSAGWQTEFLFRENPIEPLSATIFFLEPPAPFLANCAKIIVSNIPFIIKVPGNQREEPYIDGIYKATYYSTPHEQGWTELVKQKRPVYKPGIELFRNSIDSFKTKFLFNNQTGFLRQGCMYEEKKQKMGNRLLSSVVSELEISSSDIIAATEIPGKQLFTYQVPVYSRLTYAERLIRISRKNKTEITADELGTVLGNCTGDKATPLTEQIRASIVTAVLPVAKIKTVIDSIPVHTLAFRILEDALVESGTMEAQALLADLLARTGQPEFYYKRLLVKIGVTAPVINPELIKRLFALKADTVRKSRAAVAGLALANNAYMLAEDGNDFLSKNIIDELDRFFSTSARAKEDTIQWLQESGNAANKNALPVIQYCLQAKDPDLFREAAYAVRFIDDEVVDTILARQILEAPADQAALITGICILRYPAPVIRQAVYHYLAEYRETETGRQLINYLLSWKDESRAISQELKAAGFADALTAYKPPVLSQ
jgi:hypothetical protein